MDRPKHRWFIVLAVLLAGVLLLFGRQWVSTTPEQVSTPAEIAAPRAVEPEFVPTVPAPSETAKANSTPRTIAATGGAFRGRVIDAVTRQPIREFEIGLIPVAADGIIRTEASLTRAFQSETGRFAWNDVSPGTWQAQVTTRGYQLFDAGRYEIVAGKSTRESVMPLLRGYAVRGRVFELGTGAGIAGAGISFREASERDDLRPRANAKSKDDGSFVLDGVPGGEVVLVATAEDHARREVEVDVDERTPPQEIPLTAGGTIGGSVTTVTGAPIKGRIYLSVMGVGSIRMRDNASQFSFDHLPAATYSIAANTSSGSVTQEIVLGPDERRNDIILIVGGGRSVRGTLRGLRPELLRSMSLALHTESAAFIAQVDEQGAYTIRGVPPGQAQLHLSGAGREFARWVKVPADEDLVLDFTFPPGVRLSGRVTQGGRAMANKNVWVSSPALRRAQSYRAFTDADGRYEIEALPPGDYQVQADQDISRRLSIAADTVLDIDVPLVQLAGRVTVTGSSVPLVRASVFVRGSDTSTAGVRVNAQTDDFGQFTLTGIEPGELLLTVYKPGYELYREKVSYSAPITNKTIALRADRGVEIRVHLSNSNAEPVRELIILDDSADLRHAVMLRIPVDREGLGFLPSALSGDRLRILPLGDYQWIAIPEWDGLPLDVTF